MALSTGQWLQVRVWFPHEGPSMEHTKAGGARSEVAVDTSAQDLIQKKALD